MMSSDWSYQLLSPSQVLQSNHFSLLRYDWIPSAATDTQINQSASYLDSHNSEELTCGWTTLHHHPHQATVWKCLKQQKKQPKSPQINKGDRFLLLHERTSGSGSLSIRINQGFGSLQPPAAAVWIYIFNMFSSQTLWNGSEKGRAVLITHNS